MDLGAVEGRCEYDKKKKLYETLKLLKKNIFSLKMVWRFSFVIESFPGFHKALDSTYRT